VTRVAAAGMLLAALLLLRGGWSDAHAQQPDGGARSTHRRVPADRETVLELDRVRLVVPAGAVAPHAVVGLGVGGVPAPPDGPPATGVIVTAAGGLHAPVAVVIALTAAERAALAGRTPALRDTATGTARPCLAAADRVACPVERPGAYLLATTEAPPPDDPLLRHALTPAGTPTAVPGGGRPLGLIVALVALAAAVGAGIALLAGRRPSGGAGARG
jgi:hypothetical protein